MSKRSLDASSMTDGCSSPGSDVDDVGLRRRGDSTDSSGSCKRQKGMWSDAEDDVLRQLVRSQQEGVGGSNWGDVAAFIPGRSAKQCRERWKFNLSPQINKSEWTSAEDAVLLQLQSSIGNRWALIAKSLPGRTENAIKTRFRSLQRAENKRWTFEEDRILLSMRLQRCARWETIADALPKRSKNGVKTRFKQLVQPGSAVPPALSADALAAAAAAAAAAAGAAPRVSPPPSPYSATAVGAQPSRAMPQDMPQTPLQRRDESELAAATALMLL